MACHQHKILKTQIWEGDPVILSSEVLNGRNQMIAASQVESIVYSVFRFTATGTTRLIQGPTPLVVADVWTDGGDEEGWNFRSEIPTELFVTQSEFDDPPVYRIEIRGTPYSGDAFWVHAAEITVNEMYSL